MSVLRLFSFDDPTHRDVTRLLPWHVNGTLDGTERARVEDHVRRCVACRHELDLQQRIADAIRSDAVPTGMAKGLARLHAQFDFAGLASVGARGQAWWRRPAVLVPLVAAQLAVIAVLLFVDGSRPVPTFRTLASPSSTAYSRDAVVVIFDPAATQQRVQALLRELDARIVDGPNTRGAYTLEPPHERQAATLERLRRMPEVTFAQPAPGSTGMKP
jgi:hypothetical protein